MLKHLKLEQLHGLILLADVDAAEHHKRVDGWVGEGNLKVVSADEKLSAIEEKTEAALKLLINALSDEEKFEITALAWAGRDDDDFADTLQHARATQNPTYTAVYLTGKKELGRYWRAGLKQIGLPVPA